MLKNADLPINPAQMFDPDAPPGMRQRSCPGLSKREYFAAMAMQGFCSDGKDACIEGIAESSVKMADSLLAALSK